MMLPAPAAVPPIVELVTWSETPVKFRSVEVGREVGGRVQERADVVALDQVGVAGQVEPGAAEPELLPSLAEMTFLA